MTRQPRVFASGVPHPETVVVGPDGHFYAGTATGHYLGTGPVVRISPDGRRVSPFADTGGRVLGLDFLPGGELVACDTARAQLVILDRRGRPVEAVSQVDGWRLTRPNGCVVDQAGGIWFTDSGTAQAGEATGALLYLHPDGKARIAATDLVFPNGIGLSPAGDALYVTLTRDDALLRFDVAGPGRLGPPRVLAGGAGSTDLAAGPDGLSVALDGSVLLAVTRTSRVVSVSPDGTTRILAEDPRALRMPSHVAVAGDRLFVPSLFGDTICELVPDPATPHTDAQHTSVRPTGSREHPDPTGGTR